MKNVYQILSDRGGHYHNFVNYNDEGYVFLPAEDWMPIYVDSNGTNIWIDTEGGPYIGEGWHNDEITVVEIHQSENRILFTLKENSKD